MSRCSRLARVALLVGAAAGDARAQGEEGVAPVDIPGAPERAASPAPVHPPEGPYLFEIGARGGYATAPIRGGVNPFGLGAGVRLGFNISGFVLGASAMDYMGGSDVGATDSAWLFCGELGYSFRIGRYFTVRPLLGVGDAMVSHTEPSAHHVDVITSASGGGGGGRGGGITITVNNILLEPGLGLQLATTNYFLGFEFSSLLLPGILYGPAPAQQTTWISYAVEAQAGFRL